MKKLSLQWRITLMTALLIGATCIFMNVLIGYSGSHYMDSIGSYVTGYGDTDKGEPDFFDPEHEKLDRELTIVINGAQESFIATNWYITAAATLLGGVLAYFLSGHALKPLRTFTARVEKVQPNNLTDMKITEEVPPEKQEAKPLPSAPVDSSPETRPEETPAPAIGRHSGRANSPGRPCGACCRGAFADGSAVRCSRYGWGR